MSADLQKFLYTVDDPGVPHLQIGIMGQNDVLTSVQRLRERERLQRLAPVDNHLVQRLLPEHLVVVGDPDQKFPLVSNGPVPVNCRDQIHEIYSPFPYMRIKNLCRQNTQTVYKSARRMRPSHMGSLFHAADRLHRQV